MNKKIIKRFNLFALLLIAILPIQVQALSCSYALNINNKTGHKLTISDVKVKFKQGVEWKNWHSVGSIKQRLAENGKYEWEKNKSSSVCYYYKFKFKWSCQGNSGTKKTKQDDPDGDRSSNLYAKIKDCNGDMNISDDGGFGDFG